MRKPIFFSIILVLLLGGAYFYQSRFSKTGPRSLPKQSIEGVVALNKKPISPESGGPASRNGAHNLSSLFGQIPFLGKILQPTLFVDESENPSPTASALPAREPTDGERKLQTEIRNYLIASSDVGFSKSAAGLRQALENARGGDPLPLTKIRGEFKQQLEGFRTLPHPEQTNNIHKKSVDIIEQYIQLMDDTIHQTKGSVEATWNSDDLKRIINDAAATKQEIIQLVTDYRIVLPPGIVL